MIFRLFLIIFVATMSHFSQAEMVEWQDYQIHYTALNSMLI
ncbi:MAG: hypothetical protein ACI9FB_001649, partial [Candidatus Azotimanducaceae bacterium]